MIRLPNDNAGYACLMRVEQILSVDGVINAVRQAELLSEVQSHCCLETTKHKVLCNAPFGNAFITMLTGSNSEHIIGLNSIPKLNVVHRLKPLFHVLNIFKYDHASSLPDRIPSMQTCEE